MIARLLLAVSVSGLGHIWLLREFPQIQFADIDFSYALQSVELVIVSPAGVPLPEAVPEDKEKVPEFTESEVKELEPLIKKKPEVSPGFEKPRPIAAPEEKGLKEAVLREAQNPPVYPMLARQKEWEGTVLINVEVLEDGTCGEIKVLKSSGYDILDRAAVNGVKNWEFQPATLKGRPIRSWVEIPIIFKLE